MGMLGFDWMTFVLSWFVCAQIGKFTTLSGLFLRKVVFVRPPGVDWLKFNHQRRKLARNLQEGFKAQMSSGGVELMNCSDYVLTCLPFYEQVEVLMQNLVVAVLVHVAMLLKRLLTGYSFVQSVLLAALLLPMYQLCIMLWQVHELTWYLGTVKRACTSILVFLALFIPLLWGIGTAGLNLGLPPRLGGLLDLDLETSAEQFEDILSPIRAANARHSWLASAPAVLMRWLPAVLALPYAFMCIVVEGNAAFQADSGLHFGLRGKHQHLNELPTALRPPHWVAAFSQMFPLLLPTLWIPSLSSNLLPGHIEPCVWEIARHVALLVFCSCRLLSVPGSLQYAVLEAQRQDCGLDASSPSSATAVNKILVWLFQFLAFPASILLLSLHGLSTAMLAACCEAQASNNAGKAVVELIMFENSTAEQSGERPIQRLKDAFADLGQIVPPEAVWRSVQFFLVAMLFTGALGGLAGTFVSRAEAFDVEVETARQKRAANLEAKGQNGQTTAE